VWYPTVPTHDDFDQESKELNHEECNVLSAAGGTFWLFSGGALLTIVLVAWLIPETGLILDEKTGSLALCVCLLQRKG